MRFAAIALTALAGLALAACTGGVTSPQDVSGDLKIVTPLHEGTYQVIPSDNDAQVAITRHGEDYRMNNPTGGDKPLTFRVLAMPELPRSRYLVQVDDPDEKTGKLTYHYYFAIIGTDQFVVLTPSKYDLEDAHLGAELKKLIEVKGGDEVHVPDAGNTLAALKLLTADTIAQDVILQFARVN